MALIPLVMSTSLCMRRYASDGSDLPHCPVPISPGGEHKVSKLFTIRPFATMHPVPSQGYVVYSTKEKLKPEHAGLSGKEIGELRKSGVKVTDTVEVPEVAFTGDTTADWIDSEDPVAQDALRAKLLICECTFVDDVVRVVDSRPQRQTLRANLPNTVLWMSFAVFHLSSRAFR